MDGMDGSLNGLTIRAPNGAKNVPKGVTKKCPIKLVKMSPKCLFVK